VGLMRPYRQPGRHQGGHVERALECYRELGRE
jgi:hypothetical protein